MTNDNKPPMFGPSGVFDPATYEPRSGKTFWMAATDVSSLADKEATADTLIGNCTTSLPFKFEFDPKGNGHTMLFAPTRAGMSADYSALALTEAEVAKAKALALSSFARDVLLALRSMRKEAEASGVSLATLSRLLGMKSTPECDREILDALQQLNHPGTSCHRNDRDEFRLTPRGSALLQNANATSQRRKAAEHLVPETPSVTVELPNSNSWWHKATSFRPWRSAS